MTFKLPEPAVRGPDGTGTYFDSYTEAQLKQAIKDVLEQAAQEATDAIAFNGGTVQMEAHVREAIRKMIGEIK